MKYLSILVIMILPLFLMGQKDITLKKKYLGKYKGSIPGYQIQTDKEVVDVTASSIYVDIQRESIDLTIGNHKLSGTYTVLFKSKTYYLIEVYVDGQPFAERMMVYTRGKRIAREGLYPQPMAELERY